MRPSLIALGTEKAWLASTASFTSEPIASRTAVTRLASSFKVAQADLHLDRLEAGVLELQRFLDRLVDQAIHVDEAEPVA